MLRSRAVYSALTLSPRPVFPALLSGPQQQAAGLRPPSPQPRFAGQQLQAARAHAARLPFSTDRSRQLLAQQQRQLQAGEGPGPEF